MNTGITQQLNRAIQMKILKNLFNNNRQWATKIKESDPDFFSKLSKQQNPEYLWIGCSDSRVPSKNKQIVLPHILFYIIFSLFLLFTTGCATMDVGHDFPDHEVKNIQIGQTTKEEIHTIFGEPWRVGLENGKETWTYGKYTYSGTKETDAKDLFIRFTKNDIVESYTYSTTNR